jgi:hypothetical protein
MLNRNKRKMGISLLLLALAAILFRLAYAMAANRVSLWLMGAAVMFLLAALMVFARYFRE